MTEPVKPLREWLHEFSAARRAVRALKAKHGETRAFAAGRPTPEFVKVIEILPPKRMGKKPGPPRVRLLISEAARTERNNRIVREQRKRAELVTLQDFLCYLCGDPFTTDAPPTLEHVWPKSRGGKTAGNVLAAHGDCNVKKGDRVPTTAEMAFLRSINARLSEPDSERPPHP